VGLDFVHHEWIGLLLFAIAAGFPALGPLNNTSSDQKIILFKDYEGKWIIFFSFILNIDGMDKSYIIYTLH